MSAPRRIDFYRHPLNARHVEAISRVVQTPFLTTGSVGRAVEEQLQQYFGVDHALLVNSWTNGAFAALLAMDIGPGDEVVVPANTFIATANVVELTGATVVFCDADPETLLVTPEHISSAVGPRTRLVMPVHMYGQMCDIAGIRDMLDAHPLAKARVRILEDAAHCFEGERGNAKPGRHSDLAVFSFYATKNVTTGEGGAMITQDGELYERLVETRLHGMSAIAVDRFAGDRYNHWDMMRLGTKANLPDILAALLPEQIDTIDARLDERQVLAERYRAAFADSPLRLVKQLEMCKSAEHIFPLGVNAQRRDDAIAALNAAGVPITVNYTAVPDTTYYRKRYDDIGGQFPVSRSWGQQTLTLPLFPGMTPDEQDYVIEVVKERVFPLA